MPVGLSPCRSMKATHKKSAAPGSTTPCAPTPAHRRRSDLSCGTKPSVAAGRPPTVPSADARTSSPTRTYPTELVWFFGSPSQTTGSASRIPGACASPGRSPLAASASRTSERIFLGSASRSVHSSAWVLNSPFGITDQNPAHGYGEQARGVPHGCRRSDLDPALPAPIPVSDRGELPNGFRVLGYLRKFGQALSFEARSPYLMGASWRSRFVESSIQAQAGY